MTITSAKTNKYGPGSINIQFEAGADFSIDLHLNRGEVSWDLTGATFEACVSNTWNPGATTALMTVTVIDATGGDIRVSLSKEAIDAIQLPVSPAKLPSPTALGKPSRTAQLGGWTLTITQDGVTQRLIDGDVQLDRDPCRQ